MTIKEQPPVWAMKRACDELNLEYADHVSKFVFWDYSVCGKNPIVHALANLIVKYEQPPVDPILAAAREAVARWHENCNFPSFAAMVRSGSEDGHSDVGNACGAITLYLEREASK